METSHESSDHARSTMLTQRIITHASEAHGLQRMSKHDAEHDEHVFHQLSNKPWAALYVAAFFFFMISLGVLAFYAIQRAAQAGWSPVSIQSYGRNYSLLTSRGNNCYCNLSSFGNAFNHLFIWMDPEVVAHDKLIAGKVGFLNVPFF